MNYTEDNLVACTARLLQDESQSVFGFVKKMEAFAKCFSIFFQLCFSTADFHTFLVFLEDYLTGNAKCIFY